MRPIPIRTYVLVLIMVQVNIFRDAIALPRDHTHHAGGSLPRYGPPFLSCGIEGILATSLSDAPGEAGICKLSIRLRFRSVNTLISHAQVRSCFIFDLDDPRFMEFTVHVSHVHGCTYPRYPWKSPNSASVVMRLLWVTKIACPHSGHQTQTECGP